MWIVSGRVGGCSLDGCYGKFRSMLGKDNVDCLDDEGKLCLRMRLMVFGWIS